VCGLLREAVLRYAQFPPRTSACRRTTSSIPENRYKQIFKIQVELPADISAKDRQGILRSIDRCTVKKVVQTGPEFVIEEVENLDADAQALLTLNPDTGRAHLYRRQGSAAGADHRQHVGVSGRPGHQDRDRLVAQSRAQRVVAAYPRCALADVLHQWQGRDQGKRAGLGLGRIHRAPELQPFLQRPVLGRGHRQRRLRALPGRALVQARPQGCAAGRPARRLLPAIYNPDGELRASHLYDTNSGNIKRGICALPYVRQSDGEVVYFPTNLIDNLFLSNGMSAGNTLAEAQVQCLSEIFERAVKREIIEGEIALPDVPPEVLAKYPGILAGIEGLEKQGFPVLVKDASLGGEFPVMCVTLMNPRTGGVFASFGAHPSLEVALERSLTELLQGRSFEGLNDLPRPPSRATPSPSRTTSSNTSSIPAAWCRGASSAPRRITISSSGTFSGHGENSNADEAATLFGILEDMGKEAYMAVYDQLGATACRILVPGYSEVYPVEDLIWDNTNKALAFRADILNLHRLDDAALEALLERLEDSELDDYTDIITLIGIEFDENTVWGQLTILELKLLINLALKQFEAAQGSGRRSLPAIQREHGRARLFYQALNVVLEVLLDDELELADYEANFRRMYGNPRMDAVLGSVDGSVRFYGLTPTSMKLEGLDRHQRLIDSYKKLHVARKWLPAPAPSAGTPRSRAGVRHRCGG
jgi:ribosomal protein S12 methylthiotransferase accessory factor